MNYSLTSLNVEIVFQKVADKVLRILDLSFLMPHQGKNSI